MFAKNGADQNKPIALIEDSVVVFSRGAAEEYLATLRHACAASTSGSLTVLPDLPTLGDETYGISIKENGFDAAESRTIEIDMRRGDVLERVSLVSFTDDLQPSEALDLAKRLDAKLVPGQARLQPAQPPGNNATPTLDPGSVKATLLSALPAIADLPRGWALGGTELDLEPDLLDVCHSTSSFPRRQRAASRAYVGGIPQANIAVSVLLYSASDADAVMQRIGDGSMFATGCSGRVSKLDVTWSFEQLSLPIVGDKSVAWRATALHVPTSGLSADSPTVAEIRLTFIVSRRKDLVAVTVLTNDYRPSDGSNLFEKSQLDALQSFARATDAKLQSIVDRVKPE